MNLINVLSLAALISVTLATCNEGCLVCKSNGNCLLCDFVNAYYLNNNACFPDGSGSCKLYQVNSLNGNCLICNDGYYLDATQKCVEVTTEILNCKSYSSSTSCSQCKAGYIIQSNICAEVTAKIDN